MFQLSLSDASAMPSDHCIDGGDDCSSPFFDPLYCRKVDPMATPHCSAAGQRSNDGRVRAETPPRRRDVTDYSSALKNQALANRVVDLTPKCLDSMPRRHVTDAVIWLPRLSGRRSYDD